MTADMPAEMEAEFRLIQNEIYAIIAKWRTFLDLFGDEATVALLNSTAPVFFRLVQDTFVDDVILSIGRLLDPPKSMGKENLSLARLLDDLAKAGFSELHTEMGVLYSELRREAAQLLAVRNKNLAHNDLATRQAGSASLYVGISRNALEALIQKLCTLMNRIHAALSDTETYYESAGNLPSGAPALLRALRKLRRLTKQESDRAAAKVNDQGHR
jgi:hypothetical protein